MAIKIQFATDFVCPYCFAAEIPLQQALMGRDDVEIELLPIELTPVFMEPVDTYHDEKRREKWAKDLIPFCNEIGVTAHFPPKVIPRPYTHLAWQGYHYAAAQGKGQDYADAMYHAYFVDEQDIGDMNVLCRVAETLQLDQKEFRSELVAGTYSDFQEKAVLSTRQMGVKGVPTIWINGVQLISDLMTKEDFDFYLDQAETGNTISDADNTNASFVCGPSGC